MTCEECMNGSPYKFCCKLECGQHEFCKNCSYTNKNKSCCENEQTIQHSEELDNNSTEDYF